MSFISSGENTGKKFRLENKLEKWLAYAPIQRAFGFYVTEDSNSESEAEEKNNDKPDNHEDTSPGEETSDGDNFSKNKLAMALISSGKNRGKQFRLENKLEEWSAYAPNQRVFGFFVTEDRNSESGAQEKNNDKPDSQESTSPGEETSDGDNFSKDKQDFPVEYRTCTCEHRDKPKSENGRGRFCGFNSAHVKLASHTSTSHGVSNSVESSSSSDPSTSGKSSKENLQGNENKNKKNEVDQKLKREAVKGNLEIRCLRFRKFPDLSLSNKYYWKDHENTSRFSCGKCDKSFRYFKNYKTHQRGHSATQTDRNRYSDVGNRSGKRQLSNKMKKQELPFECPICYRKFSGRRELDGHVRMEHTHKPKS